MTNTVIDPGTTGLVAVPRRGRRLLTALRPYGILSVLLAIAIVLSFVSPVFLTLNNLANVLDRAAPIGLIGAALTFVVVAGKIDFSVGAIYGFSGVVAAMSLPYLGVVGASLLGIAIGVALGIANGLLVAVAGIDSFIATLVTSIIIAGLGLVITGGSLISAFAPGFGLLGNTRIAGIPLAVWIFAIVAVVLAIVLARTVFGRHVYGVGDNTEAARLSGVRINGVILSVFALSGFAAALAGLIITSRTGQAQPMDGLSITIAAIAAVVIGGTSISGGRGAVWRTVVGALLLSVIANGTNLLSIDPVYQQIIQGVIILGAIVADRIGNRGGR